MTHRINITLSDTDYETFKTYASVVGRSPTRLAADLLLELMPAFNTVVQAVKLVETDKAAAIHSLQGLLFDGLQTATTMASDLHKELNHDHD